MPMARRLPKRGFRNPFRREIITTNPGTAKCFSGAYVVDADALMARGLIKKRGDGVKLLGKGEIQYPLSVKLDALSKGARTKIAAGGSVVEVV